MSVTSGFFSSESGDRVYTADQFSRVFDGVIVDGIFSAVDDAMMVTENSPVAMNILVSPGRAWFNGTWTRIDADELLTISNSHATLGRIDVVYLVVNKDTGVRANSVGVATGTPSSTPVAPTLTDTANTFYYRLAEVLVPAASTTVIQDNITNLVGTAETPFVSGPLGGVSVDALLAQWTAQWTTWFDSIKGQLTTEQATNLQNQIWAIVGDINPPVTDILELAQYIGELVHIVVFYPDENVDAGNGKFYMTVPPALDNGDITQFNISVFNPSTTGTVTVTIHNCGANPSTDGVDIGVANIDVNERTSMTAVTPPFITNPTIQTGEWIRVDVDSPGSGTLGLEVMLKVVF